MPSDLNLVLCGSEASIFPSDLIDCGGLNVRSILLDSPTVCGAHPPLATPLVGADNVAIIGLLSLLPGRPRERGDDAVTVPGRSHVGAATRSEIARITTNVKSRLKLDK